MEERREKVISEIKEVAERIEVTLSDYRTRYYKEMPSTSRKKICNWLKKASIDTEVLCFYKKNPVLMIYSKSMQSTTRDIQINIYDYLENAVNEVLKYYNREFVSIVSRTIGSLKGKLQNNEYSGNNLVCLANRLQISDFISLYKEKYPELIELQNNILVITRIASIRPGTLVPEIHELYGVKTLLLELEERIKIIETIENPACINFVLEYINFLIDWSWFEDMR